MAMIFGKIEDFDCDKEEWRHYIERLELLIAANSVVEKMKKSIFLCHWCDFMQIPSKSHCSK